MTHQTLSTDYLIVGSGAVGIAFTDTLLTDTNVDIIIVDRHHKPGGYRNLAYPFVTLHQPSAFYGVSSRELSNGKLDLVGLNKGLCSLASGAEVSAYFDAVMRERFLPSGRVRYFRCATIRAVAYSNLRSPATPMRFQSRTSRWTRRFSKPLSRPPIRSAFQLTMAFRSCRSTTCQV